MDVTSSGRDDGNAARLEQILSEALSLARRPGPRRDRLADSASARDMLRDACILARSQGLGLEHVIVTLKRVWAGFGDSATRQDAQEVLDWTVTACIEQYFGDSPRGPASRSLHDEHEAGPPPPG